MKNISLKLWIFALISFFLFHSFELKSKKYQPDNDFKKLRKQMVDMQLISRGIKNQKVLDAFLKVERHKFVLPEYLTLAYEDHPLPIKEGQTISQPYIVAYMTEILGLKPNDKVLEIGTGSGYQAAILAQICDTVCTVEIFETLAQDAEKLFLNLGYNNIKVKIGDGYLGWLEHAPFDAIIVTCAPTEIPEPLKEQLAEEGKIIIPVGETLYQNLVLLEKKKGRIIQKKVLPVRFVPMINREGKSY